jgi:CheY-like chemotaxis protein
LVLRALRASKNAGDHAHRPERVEDRIKGLRDGADDYLGKPFSFLELWALQALTRRSGGHEPASEHRRPVDRFDQPQSHRAGTRLDLTAKDLLSVLARRQGKSSKTAIAEMVWDITFERRRTSSKSRSNACGPSSTGRSKRNCCTPFVAWVMCWRAAVSSNSIALRLSGMFTVALLVFLLIGWALYQQVDKAWDCCPRPNWMRATACSNPPVGRYGTPEHWVKINKLKLLGARRQATSWITSGDPHYEYGTSPADPRLRPRAAGHARPATAGSALSTESAGQ